VAGTWRGFRSEAARPLPTPAHVNVPPAGQDTCLTGVRLAKHRREQKRGVSAAARRAGIGYDVARGDVMSPANDTVSFTTYARRDDFRGIRG
jgi:hypothetical protein